MNDAVAFLTGDHIFLREVRPSDVNEAYYSWLNDQETRKFLETRYVPRGLNDILDFVQSKQSCANEPFFAICVKSTGQHIGNIKLGPINWLQQRADISLLIGEKAFWGQGIATEAIKLVTAFAFNELNLNKLQAGAYHENAGSIKAFLKNGFVQEGYIKEITRRNNTPIDMVVLGMTRSDYYSRN